jgi:hypothetical protein
VENETNSSIVRNLTRAAVTTTGVALTLVAAPAVAAPPTSWEVADNDSALDALLLLGGVPLLIIAVIALLTYLPSMMRSRSTGSALAFQEKPEWFGGPRQGVDSEAVVDADPTTTSSTDKGGASARW